jgi:hypothetical protein
VTFTPPAITASRRVRWSGRIIVAGGLGMSALWLPFTWAHGPTSFDEGRLVLGADMLGWGLVLGVVPNALIAAGLVGLRPWLAAGGDAIARGAHTLIVVALLGSAAMDIAFRALGPPFAIPVIAVALIALGMRPLPGLPAGSIGPRLVGLGLLLGGAFAMVVLPMDVSDTIGGFRIFGFVGYFLAGLGWALVGLGVASVASRGTEATVGAAS